MKLPIKYPIIQAPMAGGITDEKFASIVSQYGCLGSVAGGNLSIDELRNQIQKLKQLTNQAYQVNLFVLEDTGTNINIPDKTEAILSEIKNGLNIELQPFQVKSYPTIEAYTELCIEMAVPIVSFTFGLPNESTIKKLKEHGILTIGTANNVEEAMRIEEIGMDFVVCQGYEAGGHRGGFLNQESIGLFALLPQVKQAVDIPIIAAGGITNSKTIQAANILGADYYQIGTRFLNTYEAIASDVHKNAINQAIETATVQTDKITGRSARGIQNDLIDQLKVTEVPSYPIMHQLTQEIRRQSKADNNPNYMSLWAGQNIRYMKTKYLKDVLKELTEIF